MTKKLQDLLDLPPIEEDMAEEQNEIAPSKEEAIAEAVEVMKALSNSEKIDLALTSVTGLLEHDNEMDDIAERALTSFKELNDLSKNMPDMHTGKVLEVAATMLKTAMEAKDAKVSKKLKMIDLQLKKMKIDKETNPDSDSDNSTEFDRAELLAQIKSTISDNSDK